MIKEAENIIRTKSYFELTESELVIIGDLVQNEEEFNNMKWFLLGAEKLVENEKIEASPELKKRVLAHLTESKKKKGIWLNTVGGFLVPEGKKVYQMPVFQMGVAAALIVGFLFVLNPEPAVGDLAINDRPEQIEDEKVEQNEQERHEQDKMVDSITIDDVEALTNENKVQEESEPVPAPPAIIEITEDDEEVEELTLSNDQGNAYLFSDAELDFDEVADEAPMKEEMEMADDYVPVDGNENLIRNKDLKKSVEKSKNEAQRREDLQNLSEESRDLNDNEKFAVEGEALQNAGASDMITTTNVNANATTKGITSVEIGTEVIIPKSLHINSTTELNSLFYIEK